MLGEQMIRMKSDAAGVEHGFETVADTALRDGRDQRIADELLQRHAAVSRQRMPGRDDADEAVPANEREPEVAGARRHRTDAEIGVPGFDAPFDTGRGLFPYVELDVGMTRFERGKRFRQNVRRD